MTRVLLIALGGGVGSVARYALSLWSLGAFGMAFPFGTLMVNMIGSFFLGVLMHLGAVSTFIPTDLRLAIGTGLLGGFTTYSTFNFETTELFRRGAWLYGTLNIVITLAGCFVAGLLGILAARLIAGK